MPTEMDAGTSVVHVLDDSKSRGCAAVTVPSPSSRADANIKGEIAPDATAQSTSQAAPMPAASGRPLPAAVPFNAEAASLYGQFVQAAYTMYSKNVGTPTALTPPPSPEFPQNYRLVAWIHMQDFILQSTAPSFYGFIAQGNVNPSQFVVAIRGTSNGVEWWDDANAAEKIPFKGLGCGSVGSGFARIYDTMEVVDCQPPAPGASPDQSLKAPATFSRQIAALVRRHAPAAAALGGFPASASVEVTGHSLGGALATLYVMENAKTEQIANPAVCTFASPLVGDATFAAAFNALGLTSWRVDNAQDLVTKIPPAILDFVHVDTKVPVNSAGKVMPFVTCWHYLSTYLSLIDPTRQLDPGCRLWAAAKPPPVPQPVPSFNSRSTSSGARAMTRPFAIDINHANDVQDTPGPLGGFSQAKSSGIAFLFHKATEGLSFVDKRYQARRAAWMDGVSVTVTDVNGEVLQITPRFAAYHFFHGVDPVREAEFFLRTARLQPGDDAAVDWEVLPGSGIQPSADAVDAFCNVVEEALGFPIIVYSGNVAKEQLKGKDPRFAKRRLWLADYNGTWSVQQTWNHPWLWQNNGDQQGSGPHTIPGIDGSCDNSTVVGPMTVKQLYEDWGGGPQRRPIAATVRKPSEKPISLPVKRKIARYGWKPDLPDQRDYSYAVPADVVQNIPGLVDLRPQCPAVYDQGQIGSCTANAIAGALEFDMMKQGLPSFTPSRLFIYYNERSIEGTVNSDSGAYIRDGIKSVASQGDCPESEWTYDGTAALAGGVFASTAKAAIQPSLQCYTDAVQHKALTYLSIDQNLADMKGCLASGYPFVFGFTVYGSFESQQVKQSGIASMPAAGESPIGGHAVMAVGFDDSKSMFIMRNSWGLNWGLGGYFYMPYAYLLDNNLSDDFWTIRVVGR